ncbi:ATP-binding cassette domain-containing protein [bacterium]|nr:ATP-binding cassette domain-containing protein [bacterium]
MGEQQRLEILSALHRSARILILDEPTAVLAPQEVEELFAVLSRLREAGRSIIFISHKLSEITSLCDRVTVLRKGRRVATLPVSEAEVGRLAELLAGRGVPELPARAARAPAEIVLELRELTVRSELERVALERVSLSVRAGELVGVAGIAGNGQAELEEVLAGVRRADGGELRFAGRSAAGWSARERHRAGWAQISSDRRETGLVGGMSVEENLAVRAHRAPPLSRRGFLSPGGMRGVARAALEEYAVACPGPDAPLAALSGGNQQKVVLARELRGRPRLIVACSPTRGLDVAATRFVHETLLTHRAEGAAILLVSTELDEVLALSDRLAVLFRGRLREVPEGKRSRESVGRMMLGAEP